MNNNDGLENMTKYLLNYLFKKIDDLTAENQKLKLKMAKKEIEDNVIEDLTKQAVNLAKEIGLIQEESNDQSMDSFIKKKKNEA